MTEQTPDPLADALAAHRPCPCGCGWCAANECHDLRGTGITWAAHVAAVVRAAQADETTMLRARLTEAQSNIVDILTERDDAIEARDAARAKLDARRAAQPTGEQIGWAIHATPIGQTLKDSEVDARG